MDSKPAAILYTDNLLVISKNKDTHNSNKEGVFNMINKSHLKLNSLKTPLSSEPASTSTLQTIQIKIGQNKCLAVLDPGVDSSMIKLSLMISLKKQYSSIKWQMTSDDTRSCTGADGSTSTTLGDATLEFYINDQKIESTFLVVRGLTQDCIIGATFMKENKMTLHPGSNSVTIDTKSYDIADKFEKLTISTQTIVIGRL
jgi:hypothetical protein